MVKANELRIGNWIFDRTFSDFGSPSLKPIQVDANLIKTIDLEGGKYHRNIPLTPEILEQCGFEKCSCNGYKHELIHLGMNDKKILYYKSAPLKYLHQLQNLAYALRGEELVYQPIKELT